MSASTWDLALLLIFLLLLPLRLLSFRSRLRRPPAAALLLLPILISVIFAVSDRSTPPTDNVSLLQELKIKVAQLESSLDENTQALISNSLQLEEKRKRVEEMEQKTELLENALSKIKASPNNSTHSKEKLDALSAEVHLLWEVSRKKNFDIHSLESKARDMEKVLKDVTSEVVTMENVVSQRWIQIRQLEHSLHLIKTMTSRVHTRTRQLTKCTMLKFIKSIRQYDLSEFMKVPDSFFLGDTTSSCWISHAFEQFKSLTSAAKKWHHEEDNQHIFKECSSALALWNSGDTFGGLLLQRFYGAFGKFSVPEFLTPILLSRRLADGQVSISGLLCDHQGQ